MDKTILSIVTILISGTGIIGSRYKYDPPELRLSFLGENPYAIKKQEIDNIISRNFIVLAFCGLAIQLIPIFSPSDVPNRIHSMPFYATISIVGVIIMYLFAVLMKKVGTYFAKKKWLPKIIKYQREAFESSLYIVEHNGWRPDQWENKDNLIDKGKYISANFETAAQRITQIEKLLEIPKQSNELKERISNLKRFFL